MTPTIKTSVLEFDLLGQGTLPSVCVVHPGLRSSKGSPVLHFRWVPVGRRYIRPLVLLNNGNVPAEVRRGKNSKFRLFTHFKFSKTKLHQNINIIIYNAFRNITNSLGRIL